MGDVLKADSDRPSPSFLLPPRFSNQCLFGIFGTSLAPSPPV